MIRNNAAAGNCYGGGQIVLEGRMLPVKNAKFVEKLRSTEDGDGSLLDHSILFYGAGMGDSNSHASDPLPIVAIGGGLKGPRHLQVQTRTPVGCLWSAVANRFGAPMEKFGDGVGMIDDLF